MRKVPIKSFNESLFAKETLLNNFFMTQKLNH